MRILVLINEDVIGGAEVQAKNFCKWCYENNIAVKVVFLKRPYRSNNYYVRFLEGLLFRNVIMQFILLNFIIYRYDPDILDAHLSRSCYIGIIAKFIYPNLKVVINNHTNVFEYYKSRGIFGWLNLFLTAKLFPLADWIFCVSKYCKSDLENLVVSKGETVSVIPNAIEIPMKVPQDFQHKKQKDAFTILCIGRLVEGKNIDAIIKSFSFLPSNYNLLIVGDGPLRGQLDDLVTNQNISSDRVTFFGFHDDVSKFYKEADLTILASGSESFGNVVIESFSYGKPILVYSYAKGAIEILKKYKLDFEFQSLEPENIAFAIQSIAQDPEKTSNKDRFRQIALEYSLDTVYPLKIKVLRKLI